VKVWDGENAEAQDDKNAEVWDNENAEVQDDKNMEVQDDESWEHGQGWGPDDEQGNPISLYFLCT